MCCSRGTSWRIVLSSDFMGNAGMADGMVLEDCAGPETVFARPQHFI
jgi:hypothetical protein